MNCKEIVKVFLGDDTYPNILFLNLVSVGILISSSEIYCQWWGNIIIIISQLFHCLSKKGKKTQEKRRRTKENGRHTTGGKISKYKRGS